MRYGQVYAAGYGDPENALEYYELEDQGLYVNVYFKPAAGLGNAYFAVFCDAKLIAKVYAAEGDDIGPVAVQKNGNAKNSILILRDGQLADPWYVNLYVVRSFESAVSGKFTLKWAWLYEAIGSPDSVASAWVLNDLAYTATDRVTDQVTRGRLFYDLVVTGGSVAVTVRNSSTTLATGSGAFPGTITLTGSTVTGSVAIDAAAVTISDQEIFVRWPATMSVKRGITDPPSTIVGTTTFAGTDTGEYTEPSDLAAGTYYYRIQPTSDTADTGDNSATVSGVLNGAPEPATTLAYSSGNASATVLSYTRSSTAGATYRAYLRRIGAPFINMATIEATAAAGTPSTPGTITLPAITGYAGTVLVILRAVNAGTEEKGLLTMELEYDASGNYVAPRPNTPEIDPVSRTVTSGRSLAIQGLYRTLGELGTATQLQLFKRTPTGSYNFASVDASASLGAAENGVKKATLNYTFSSNGYYYITLKAATAGSVQSAGYAAEVLVYVSDVNAAAHTFEVFASRG